MSDPSLFFLNTAFFCSLELSGPFDEHQEQNARREPGVPVSFSLCCELIFSSFSAFAAAV
jgi:hypothetical protein